MEKSQALHLLQAALSEVALPDGSAATESFYGLREVDAKVREVRMVFEGVDGLPASLLSSMSNDADFGANSRRIRLEALANYIRSALKFLNTGAFEKPKKVVLAPPDFSRLTSSVLAPFQASKRSLSVAGAKRSVAFMSRRLLPQ